MINAQSCQHLGHFCLYDHIGHGGYADVYYAIDLYLEREVAIKVFHTPVNPRNHRAVEVHAREARTLLQLRHAHIIGVIDFNIDNMTPYIVMEYAQNGSLRDIHPLGDRLDWDTILDYLAQITDALTFIHMHDVVHLDIKPANLLMNEQNEILVGDFGTVAFLQHVNPDEPFEFVGTVQYAAPERFDEVVPTPASDIYSLALIVFEWLTGESLFTGSRAALIRQHRFVKPSAKRMAALGIARPIRRVLLKALAKNPRKRYQNTLDFFDALQDAVWEAKKSHVMHVLGLLMLLTVVISAPLIFLLHMLIVFYIALVVLLVLSSAFSAVVRR